jgi:hypothetical protein
LSKIDIKSLFLTQVLAKNRRMTNLSKIDIEIIIITKFFQRTEEFGISLKNVLKSNFQIKIYIIKLGDTNFPSTRRFRSNKKFQIISYLIFL